MGDWFLLPRIATVVHLRHRCTFFEHCSLLLCLVGWYEGLLAQSRPHHWLLNAHVWFDFPASAGFKFLLATMRHYIWVAEIRGNLRIFVQIFRSWSRRSKLPSGLSRKSNSVSLLYYYRRGRYGLHAILCWLLKRSSIWARRQTPLCLVPPWFAAPFLTWPV